MSEDPIKAAQARAEQWVGMGCPSAPLALDRDEYERTYKRRIVYGTWGTLTDAQRALKAIFCPDCHRTEEFDMRSSYRMYITVNDDVMTVFKAVGHFVCHGCGFEEHHPLQVDPRRFRDPPGMMTATEIAMRQQKAYEKMKAMSAPPMAIPQMTLDEQASLYRIYNSSRLYIGQPVEASPPIDPTALYSNMQSEEDRKSFLKEMRKRLGK